MNKAELFNSFQHKALSCNSLFQVEIDVTSNCNANCPFCFQGEHPLVKDCISLDDYIFLFDQLREMGVFYIGFSGGEPFFRPDFIDIIKEAHKRHFLISITTNGSLIDYHVIDEISQLYVNRVTVSFHGSNPKTYCKSFGISEEAIFYKVLDNIDYMLKKDIKVGVAVTVTKHNISDLTNIKELLISRGVYEHNISFNMLFPGKHNIDCLVPDIELIKKFCMSDYIVKSDFSMCTAGVISCCIDSTGNVLPCTFYNSAAGNIKENDVDVIWKSSHLFMILRSLKAEMFLKCNNCQIKSLCNICPVANMNETNNMFIPSERFCTLRKSRITNASCVE